MKVALGIAIAISLTLVIWLGNALSANTRLTDKIRILNSHIAETTQANIASARQKCATQADRVFKENYKSEPELPSVHDSYTDHYDPARSKCFLTVDEQSYSANTKQTIITKFLIDAYEQREYGAFNEIVSLKGEPDLCLMVPDAAHKHQCHSEIEYDAFVSRYME